MPAEVYATWLSWSTVTNIGTHKELLAYIGGAYDYLWLSSPSGGHKAGAQVVVSTGANMMNGSFYNGGARSA